MCCEATGTLGLPAEVIEALAHYRRLLDERRWDWGDDRIELFRWARFSMLGPVLEAFWASGDWASAIRSVIGDQVPAGMVVVRVDAGGGLRADVGSPRTAIAGRTARIDVLVDSAMDADLELTVVLGAQTLIVEGAVRDDPGGRAPALVSPLRPLVGHRCQRRSLVPGGCAGEVGLPSPSVLPRSRRDPAGAGRATAGRLHPRHRVRPDGAGRPPGVHRVPGRVDRGIPAKPRDRSRRGSWSPTPRSAWSTPSTSSPRTTTRARCSSTTACCRAACGSPPRPARTSTCRSRTAPGWPPTRRAGAGSTPGSAISRCRCRPSSRPSAAGARWSPTGPG